MLGIFWSYYGSAPSGVDLITEVFLPQIREAYPEYNNEKLSHIKLYDLTIVGPSGLEIEYNRTTVKLTNTKTLSMPNYCDPCEHLQLLQPAEINCRFIF